MFLFFSAHITILFISDGLEVTSFVALLISLRRSRGICERDYDSSPYKEAHRVPLPQFL